jgi:hypothetical protein
LRKERNEAKSAPMLRDSIGDQVTSILRKDASQDGESIQKTNARLALTYIEEFREDWRKAAGSDKELRKLRKNLVKKLRCLDRPTYACCPMAAYLYQRLVGSYSEEVQEQGGKFMIREMNCGVVLGVFTPRLVSIHLYY